MSVQTTDEQDEVSTKTTIIEFMDGEARRFEATDVHSHENVVIINERNENTHIQHMIPKTAIKCKTTRKYME